MKYLKSLSFIKNINDYKNISIRDLISRIFQGLIKVAFSKGLHSLVSFPHVQKDQSVSLHCSVCPCSGTLFAADNKENNSAERLP